MTFRRDAKLQPSQVKDRRGQGKVPVFKPPITRKKHAVSKSTARGETYTGIIRKARAPKKR